MREAFKVLVAAADTQAFDTVSRSLPKDEFTVSGVNSSDELLQILARRIEDLLICDLELPEAGGLSAYRILRPERRPSVIFMGYEFGDREKREAFELGVITILKRPLRKEGVETAVGRFLKTRRY